MNLQSKLKNTQKTAVKATYIVTGLDVRQMDDAAWNSAEAVEIDHYWSGKKAAPSRHAEARILWSDEALYVRYVCNQAEPVVISDHPQTITKTMYLWDRDVCEIFLAPDRAVVEKYFEFEIAPTGEWLDVGLDWTTGRRQTDWQFSSRMTTAARIERDHVTMAMRIPWSNRLPAPGRRERWRANLFRCVGKDPKLRYLSWLPTRTPQPFFHVPKTFGWLVFS